MVGLNPRRRFAPKRSLHQEQRLLRFSNGLNIPQDSEQGFVGSEHALTPELVSRITDGGRGNVQRLMSAGHAPDAADGADGAHGGGEHGEHKHGAKEVLEHMEHLEHELHDLLKKFDNKKLQEHLQSGEYSIWTTERGFVSSTLSMMSDAKREIEMLAQWEAGKMHPDEFMAWLASSAVGVPLTKAQRVDAENDSFNVENTRLDGEIASLERLRPTDGSAFEDRSVEKRIKALKDQKRRLAIKHEQRLEKIKKDKEFLIEETPPGRPTNLDSDIFYETRSDALADLRGMSQNLDVQNESDRITFNTMAKENPAVMAFVAQKLARANAAIDATNKALDAASETNMHGRGTKNVIAEIEARAGVDSSAGGKGEKAYDPHTQLSVGGPSFISQFKTAIGSVGLKFYSAKGVMEGFHLWWEAWKGALHKYHHREGSMFADFLGKTSRIVPGFGEEVFTELEANDDKANDEVKDTYKEILTKRNVNFKALVDGPGSELSRNIADYNRTRAVLEYAASRGWLYDLDQGSQNFFFGRHIHELVPHEWDHNRVNNYVSKLTNEQNQGKKSEQEKYKQRYHNVNSTDVFVRLMEEELSSVNMWGAIGILERSIERGLWGEIAPWHTVGLIRQIQKNPLLRRYITVDFIDQFGNKSLYYSFGRWSGNVTKLTRKPWFKAIQESLKSGSLDLKNVIGTDGKTAQGIDVFLRAEKELERLFGPYKDLSDDKKKLFDRRIAQFLSGAIVEENGVRTNIFTAKFKDWTDKDVGQGQMKIDGEDEDYYREGTNGTPAETTTLADSTVFQQVFEVTGNGQFRNESRARFAMDSIVTMIEDLKEKGMTEQLSEYVRITQKKMIKWFQRYSSDARFSAAAYQGMIRPHYKSNTRTLYVVLEMVRNELLPINVLVGGLSQTGREACITMLAQSNVYIDKMPPAVQAKLRSAMSSISPDDQKKIRQAEETVRSGNVTAPSPQEREH